MVCGTCGGGRREKGGRKEIDLVICCSTVCHVGAQCHTQPLLGILVPYEHGLLRDTMPLAQVEAAPPVESLIFMFGRRLIEATPGLAVPLSVIESI